MDREVIADKTFDKVDFKKAPLIMGEYDACSFTGCDFSGTDLSGMRFVQCSFKDCNLSNIKVAQTVLIDAAFKGCKMLGIRFDECSPFGLSFSFQQCILNHSTFYKTKIRKTVFKDAQMHEADFTDCDLTGATFSGCNLAGATFDNTILERADMRTATNYSIDPERNKIKKAKFSIPEVTGLLNKYDISIERG